MLLSLRHTTTFKIVLVTLFTSLSNVATAQHIMIYDTYNTNDSKIEEVYDTRQLQSCHKYEMVVEGNYSLWTSSYWSGPCGNIETAPIYPSTNGKTNGNVGLDFEYIFSLPNASSCAGKTFPYKTTRIEISLDSGQSWFHPSTSTPYNAKHTYTYEVIGQGYPIAVRHTSGLNSDDYGRLKFTFNPIGKRQGIGFDTTLCKGDSIKFDATTTGATYLWQNGSTDPTLTASSEGIYWVDVKSSSCNFRDSFTIDYHMQQKVNLGRDTTLCSGDSLILKVNGTNVINTWHDGSTDSIYTVYSEGVYHVTSTGMHCIFSDSILVGFVSDNNISLGPDTMLCEGDTLLIHVNNEFDVFKWENGSTDTTKLVTASGKYWFEGQIGTCNLTDTIEVDFVTPPKVDLVDDTVVCTGQSIVVDVPLKNVSFEWQDGSRDSLIIINAAGLYWVKVAQANCTTIDSIQVKQQNPPFLYLGIDTVLCTGAEMTLDAQNEGANYDWNSGQASSRTLTVSESGVYHVRVTNNCGSALDSISIAPKDCSCFVFMPNAFSPNLDGLNESYKPSISCAVSHYTFTIYNRWGEQLFTANNKDESWDGRYKGQLVAEGVYFCTCTFTGISGIQREKIKLNSTIHILR